MSLKGKPWKVTIAAAALICGGAIAAAVGVKVVRYHFEGRGTDGTYHFSTEPEIVYESKQTGVMVSRGGSVSFGSDDPNFTIDVEQTQKDLEEIAALRARDERELIGVVDTEVKGSFHRTLRCKYTLSDGRTHFMGEGDPDRRAERTPEQIEKDHEEVARLREQGARELVRVIDTQIGEDLHRHCSWRYTLADGRSVQVGEGDREQPSPPKPLGVETIEEIWRLRRLKQGDFLGYSDRDVHGRTFTFETYIFTLADGTVITHAVGEPKGWKTNLTDADWEEFRSLREAGEGEELGRYEEAVKGRMFSFVRKRFVLSDGTEIIQSVGNPTQD
ncbi:MAG: hypothetical protein JW741_00060 [Sedimentisphaerales bacterium]|nr:hypothetical protein [Sedimentisphaerales bacterium]